jgi:alkylhydroperoxidase/carboxymuconolactone decarboxylase family protein YurZ
MQEYIDGRWQMPDANAPDLGRIQRQQTFLRRLATEAFRQSVKSPLTANDIADKTIPKLKADNSLGRGDINKLITSFRKVDPNDPNSLQTVTLPTEPGPTTKSLGSVLLLKQPDAETVLAHLRSSNPTTQEPQGPKPSEIRVRVFNGSGENGIASRVGSDLQQQGFVSVGVGNSPRTNVTEVHYRPGSLDKARVLQSYLGGTGRLVEDKSVVEADVSLVLGRDFKAVTPPPGATTPQSTTTPAPATTAPPATTAFRGRAYYDYLYGEVWTRDDYLTRRDRRLIAISCSAELGVDEEITEHLEAALRNGELTYLELQETVMHIAVYLGWPVARHLDDLLVAVADRVGVSSG